MLEAGKISNRQMAQLLMTTLLPASMFSLPALVASVAKEDAWISVIIASLVGVVGVWIVIMLGLRFPGKTIIEYSEVLIGKIPGKAVGLIYICFFLYLTALTAREFAEFLITVSMEDMPIIVFVTTVLAVCALAVFNGLEVIGRINELMITLVIGFSLFFMLLATGEMEPIRILPLLGNGIIPVLKGSVLVAGKMGEAIILAFLIPYINRPRLAKRTGVFSVFFLSMFLLLTVMAPILTFGALQTSRLQYPVYMVARNITYPDILERVESFFIVVWVVGIFAKISICYYVTVLATGQWLNLSEYQPLVLPIGTVIAPLSLLIFLNTSEIIGFLKIVWCPYAMSIGLGIPLILLMIAIIRRKGAKV